MADVSASERLRALDGAATNAPWHPGKVVSGEIGYLWLGEEGRLMDHDAEFIAILRNALPLIADVVEAAEKLADDADYAACYPEGAVGFEDLKDSKDKTYSTLTALREHLEGQ